MIIVTTILLWIWAFVTGSSDCQYADWSLWAYKRIDRKLIWGIHQDTIYLPNAIVCTDLSLGIGFVWLSINFYKFPE